MNCVRRPFVIGVAGGTGSGKTTVVRRLIAELGEDQVCLLQHDFYYRDRSHLDWEDRTRVNYDHPDSLETELLVTHLGRLVQGERIAIPGYNFSTHTRRQETVEMVPRPVVIVEGILVLADRQLRQLMDLRIFVDADDDLRLIRRLQRDLEERGRSLESVVEQYLGSVKPMHEEFVVPSKRHAHLIIPTGGQNQAAIEVILASIRSNL